jgi:hypothetical protein
MMYSQMGTPFSIMDRRLTYTRLRLKATAQQAQVSLLNTALNLFTQGSDVARLKAVGELGFEVSDRNVVEHGFGRMAETIVNKANMSTPALVAVD